MLEAIKRRLIKVVTKVYDPLAPLVIGNQQIKVPLSHQLRRNMVVYPDYNFNLPRIVKYISDTGKNTKVIDIGANIGDTVAFIKNFTDVPVLCIDGEKKYIDILKQNTAQYKNVSVCHSLVGETTTERNVEMKMERGTAYVAESKETTRIRSLEDILNEFSAFSNANILKVDTDGFDTFILRGCANFLQQAKPVLFFEFDPYLIRANGDDPFKFIEYLKGMGYQHLMFYMNDGDFLLSCDTGEQGLIDELIHFFSGRKIDKFTDICAFTEQDSAIFRLCVEREIAHFKSARKY